MVMTAKVLNNYVNTLYDDYFENKIDYNEFHDRMIELLKMSNNIDDKPIIKYIYAIFKESLCPILIELFPEYPQILDFIDDTNKKLNFIEEYSSTEELLNNQTILLKYEWDEYTMVGETEKQKMLWIKDFLKVILYDMKVMAENDGYIRPTIKYLCSGSYFQVYKIGNEVLKLGERKHSTNNNFSYNYLVAHLSREFSENYVIEICPYTRRKNFSFDEVQQLYEEERKLNNCWADCKEDNMGILIKDNIPRYNNLTELGYQFLGTSKRIDVYKKKGEYVIIDRDFCYDLNKNDITKVIYHYSGGNWVKDHEECYQKSLKK